MNIQAMLYASALALTVTACDRSGPQSAADFDRPESVCIAETTMATIKSIVFDAARKQNGGDPLRLNDLERGSSFRISQAVVVSNDKDIRKISCKGRATIGLPVGVSELFDNDRELQADVEYSAQPTADGKDSMIEVGGTNAVATRLASADLSRWQTSVQSSVPQSVSGVTPPASSAELAGIPVANTVVSEAEVDPPSFRCKPSNSATERLVCSTAELRSKDRDLVKVYRSALDDASEFGRYSLRDEQRTWLAGRSECGDAACLEDLYDERIEALQR